MSLKTVLVVDDYGINRLLPGLVLRPFGWEVYEVSSGRDALAFLREKTVCCILLDISMPDMSGLDVLRELRSSIDLKCVKIIAYTANVDDEESKLIGLGFDAVLFKPITNHKLLRLLES